MTSRRAWASAPLALSFLLGATAVRAQDAAALAARRTLLEQAQQARDASDHARALELAERAGRISMTPSLRLFIAQEQSSLGRLAEALGNADQCMREAEADTALRNRETLAQTCRLLADDLRGRVGNVVVAVQGAAPPGLRVTVAGRELPEALFGVAYPVTPGQIVVEATASGYAPFRREFDVTAGQSLDVPLALTRAEAQAEQAASRPPAPRPVEPPRDDHPAGGPGAGPFVAMGVGAAGLIGFGVFGLLRNSALGRCDAVAGTCPDEGTISSVYTFTTAANVSLGVGVVGVAAGVVWLLVGSGGGRQPPRTALEVSPVRGGGVVFGLGGTL